MTAPAHKRQIALIEDIAGQAHGISESPLFDEKFRDLWRERAADLDGAATTQDTLFRVGGYRNVEASRLVEMALAMDGMVS